MAPSSKDIQFRELKDTITEYDHPYPERPDPVSAADSGRTQCQG